MKLIQSLTLLLLLSIFSFAKEKKALNIILLIGDGMGLSQVSSTYVYANSEPIFSQFNQIGLIKTSSATHKVTDSAAGATAFATGKKTYNDAIGVTVDTVFAKNITEILAGKGYVSGIVVTSSVTDATPASFYAHAKSRSHHFYIAEQLISSNINFFAGGGLHYFREFLNQDSLKILAPQKNFVIDTLSLKSIKKPNADVNYGFILADDGMPPYLKWRKDFLPEATQSAIDFLLKNEEGFFLMIEGSQIDWAGHSNHSNYLITEMLDFNKTIKVALDFAKRNKNTLIIVTADHETGGFTLGPKSELGYDGYNMIEPNFAITEHSATMVPVFVKGPQESLFGGIYENNKLFTKILEAIKNNQKR